MSLSFTVAAGAFPPFTKVLELADLGEHVELEGAGWTGDGWPKGLFARIADASTTPTIMALGPELDAPRARAGLASSFLAHVRGCARGVDVAKSARAVTYRVLALSSPEDYALAVRLAAATARATGAAVDVHQDATDGGPRRVAPDELLARFGADFASKDARQAGTWLAEDIASERTYYFQCPRGFVKLAPADLASVPKDQRFDAAVSALRGEGQTITAKPDARRDAVLLTASMAFAAAADGRLDEEEARQLEAHFTTVRELRAFPAKELLEGARSEVRGIEELASLSSRALKRKAFVLSAEVIASARNGTITGDPQDPNVKAIATLVRALDLESDPVFVAEVVRTVSAKYMNSGADDALTQALVSGMVLAAAADGHVDADESAVLAGLARTVPELRARDFAGLMEDVVRRIEKGPDSVLRELATLSAQRNKAFALAAEVALVAGRGEDGTMLPRLREVIAPDVDVADGAVATFAAKYC